MEEDLIRRAREGDQAAFRRLIESYDAVAQRTARALLQERGLAEDAVQEAWLDAWRGLPGFRDGHPFRPWLLALVANRCRMKVRRRRLPLIPFARALSVASTNRSESDPALLIDQHDPALAAALAQLNDDQRRVLTLRFYADLELNEVAAILGVPLGTVKSRLHRALQTLRQQLTEAAEPLGRTEGA